MLSERTFTSNGFSMNYGEGLPTGKPLIFLHGATTWWKDFEPLIPTLMETWHVYACDMRGHGKSGRTPGKYHAVDFAPDIIDLIQKQIQEPVVLIGHSAGGVYAFLVAAQIPELVHGVVLLDPATSFRNTRLEAMQPWVLEWSKKIADILSSNRPAKEFLLELNPGVDDAGWQSMEMMIRSIDPEFVSCILRNDFFKDLNLEKVLTKVICPTLMVYGEFELGSLVPNTEAEFLKHHIHQLVAYQIKGAGHSPHWEQTDITIGCISDFLNNLSK